MENLVHSLGGYESWLYTSVMLGTLMIGFLLRIKWALAAPIPLFGLLLMYLYLDNRYNAVAPNIPDAVTSGLASVMPILAVAIGLLVVADPTVVSRVFWITREKK